MISPGHLNHRIHARWRSLPLVGALATAGVLLGTSALAHADLVRITSINGDYEANHAAQINVRPGDVVMLSADVFADSTDGSGGLVAQSRYAEDFVWTADDRSGDECDASQGQNCLGATQFEVNNYGVSFYVPNDMGGQLTLRVRSSSSYGTEDVIVLSNTSYVESGGAYQPPTTVVTDPSQYQNASFDPYTSLAGHGHWVYISGTRYFVPYTYQPNWVPYQHGYWSWTDDGWTWVSYDPWGWVTDHYGAWRHHSVYGWTWLPFEDFRYRPHCVSWFHDGDGRIGWYPYCDNYRQGYRQGYDEGFNDGYWAGYGAGHYYGDNAAYVPGWTVIRFGDFGHSDCFERRLEEREARETWQSGYGRGFYGAYPGMGDAHNMRESRGWVEQRSGARVIETRVEGRSFGGRELRYPVAVHAVPAVYSNPPYIAAGSLNRPFPVGAVFHPGAGAGRPVFTPPTSDGRGIATAPRVFDPVHNVYHPLPPATAHPVVANPGNPIYHPIPVSGHPGVAPVYHPGQPPVYHPPVVTPPAYHPPTYTPPAYHPPVVTPPAYHPPTYTPPAYHPPVVTPPAYHPPTYTPPAYHPPVVTPPAYHPPTYTPPAYHPPVVTPPAYHPPTYTPPAYHPPVVTPPAYHPPTYTPPAYHPPVVTPPAYHPPTYTPPAYHPPVVTPPAYHPPTYTPPAYHPPVSHPNPPSGPHGPHHLVNNDD